MLKCFSAILILLAAFMPALLSAADNRPASTEQGQLGSMSPQWVEGANVKVNSDVTTQLQNEESGVVNPANPDNVVAIWRDFRLGYRRIGVGNTFDGGVTWSDSLLVGTAEYPRASDPVMSYLADGTMLACVLSLSLDQSISAIHIYSSTNGGTSWSEPFAAIDEGGASGFEDKQWINADRTGGTYHNRIYVPWARFGAVTQIMMVYSIGPTIFSAPVQVSDVSGVQWPTVAIGPDGTVYVAWVSFSFGQIMLDRSTDGGASWGEDVVVTPTNITSNTINGGILTFGFPALDADISGNVFNGNLYVSYANYAGDGALDLYVRKSTDGGYTWSNAVRINDDPQGNGADQFHNWICVDEDGIVTACWYDRRHDPANLKFDLYLSHSFDGGNTWTANRRISEVSSDPSDAFKKMVEEHYAELNIPGRPAGAKYDPQRDPMAGLIGEYVALSTRNGIGQLVWTDTRNGNQDAYSARITIGFSAPPLYLPANNTVTNNPDLSFSWGKTGATPAEIANFPGSKVQPLRYLLEVDDNSGFGSIDYADTVIVPTAHQLSSSLPDGVWFWRVQAINDSGRATGFAEAFRVLTVDVQPPELPVITKPDADSEVEYQTQTYEWTAVTKQAEATPVTYNLQVSQDSTFGSVEINVGSLPGNSYVSVTPLSSASTYYCRVKATDGASNSSGFTSARRFYTKAAYICGDADHSGNVDISDAVYLIAYIFAGGPAPVPLLAGDADCSGNVDISDAVYLIAYIFGGGPAPCAGC